jgi:hypothetical protein
MLGEGGDEPGQELGRQVVAHAVDDFQFGARDGGRRVLASRRRDHRVGAAVHH